VGDDGRRRENHRNGSLVEFDTLLMRREPDLFHP
jgi:hypothetical protein